ncbi:hypothetical protein N7522_006403 [Penicillium canescens]|nr:hypothetical protein N7522_006403 [Penicillium canescens]KAJ6064836.1 hypothetical protein N7444_000489 [Penicillium canescens]
MSHDRVLQWPEDGWTGVLNFEESPSQPFRHLGSPTSVGNPGNLPLCLENPFLPDDDISDHFDPYNMYLELPSLSFSTTQTPEFRDTYLLQPSNSFMSDTAHLWLGPDILLSTASAEDVFTYIKQTFDFDWISWLELDFTFSVESVTGIPLSRNCIRFLSEANGLKSKRPSASLEDVRRDILDSFSKGGWHSIQLILRVRRDLASMI